MRQLVGRSHLDEPGLFEHDHLLSEMDKIGGIVRCPENNRGSVESRRREAMFQRFSELMSQGWIEVTKGFI